MLTTKETVDVLKTTIRNYRNRRDHMIASLEIKERHSNNNFTELVEVIRNLADCIGDLKIAEDELEYAYNLANSAVAVRIERLGETINELKQEYESPQQRFDNRKYDQISLAQKLMDTLHEDLAEVNRHFGREEENTNE